MAVAQPLCGAMDPVANALVHADVVRRAAARVVVLPEMSLTGYELHAPAVGLSDGLWDPLVGACAEVGCLALVGAPVSIEGEGEFIAIVAVSAAGPEIAYRKVWLGDQEAVRFSAGPGPAVVQVDGWRIGLGICRDISVAEHLSDTAALGMDVFAAGLADVPQDLVVQRRRARHIARTCQVHVAFASFAGPTGRGYEQTAGGSAVYSPLGRILKGCGAQVGAIAGVSIR
jgi:predicted amidohydrolase